MLKKRIWIGSLVFILLLGFFGAAFYFRYKIAQKYDMAIALIEKNDYESYIEAQNILNSIGDYKETYEWIDQIENCIITYESAKTSLKIKDYLSAIQKFEDINYFYNSKEYLNEAKYKYAELLFENKQYDMSYKYYEQIDNYLDSKEKGKTALLYSLNEKKQQLYDKALQYMESKDYLSAKILLETILDYKYVKQDIPELIKKCEEELDKQKDYNKAKEYFEEEAYIEAYIIFSCLGDYEDSTFFAKECKKKFIKETLATTISAGLHYSVALKGDGKIYCTNPEYIFEGWNDIVSISGFGTMVIGLEGAGTVKLEGHKDIYDEEGIDVRSANINDWKDIIQISAGQQHVVGLKKDGHVLVAGLNIPSKADIEGWSDIVFIDTSWINTVGLSSKGTVNFAGNISKYELDKIKSWTDVKAVATGGGAVGYPGKGHVVGLRNDGTVVAAGDNEYGQCDVDDWTEIIAISAGDWHTVGLKSNGDVVSTRPSNPKEISTISACNVDDWTDIVAISAGCGITLGLQRDGNIRSTGYTKENQRPMDNEWNNVKVYDEWDSMIARQESSQKK